jgi:hypothetical protein
MEECENIKIISQLVLGEQPGIFTQKILPTLTIQPVDLLSQTLRRLFQHDKRPPKSVHLINLVLFIELAKQQILLAKKLLSLQPVVRTRRCYSRNGLIKHQKSFQGLAMYGHEVLTSLQTPAKFFGTLFLYAYVSNIGLSGE